MKGKKMKKQNKQKLLNDLADALGVDRDTKNKAYVLLDRTGSMSSMWEEAVNSINTYINDLEGNVDVYLACFDTSGFEVLRECKQEDYEEITDREVTPRYGTNLYDAAARVLNKMLSDNPERAVFVVMTDGEENSSVEYTLAQVKKLLTKIKKQDWPAVFLGANFKEVTRYSTSTFGIGSGSAATFGTGNMVRGMALNSVKTTAYFKSGDTSAMTYTDAEKEDLKNESSSTSA